MPDLLTHYTFGYFLSRNLKRWRVVFYLGVILPDIISRPVYILFPQYEQYTVAMHTPVFLCLFCLLLSEFFAPDNRKQVFTWLSLGVLSHFFLDFFQRHFFGGYYWLFPFSWKNYEIGLFWPETPLMLAPLWLALMGLTELYLFWKRKH